MFYCIATLRIRLVCSSEVRIGTLVMSWNTSLSQVDRKVQQSLKGKRFIISLRTTEVLHNSDSDDRHHMLIRPSLCPEISSYD